MSECTSPKIIFTHAILQCPVIFQVNEKHYLVPVIKLPQWADSWHQLSPMIREREIEFCLCVGSDPAITFCWVQTFKWRSTFNSTLSYDFITFWQQWQTSYRIINQGQMLHGCRGTKIHFVCIRAYDLQGDSSLVTMSSSWAVGCRCILMYKSQCWAWSHCILSFSIWFSTVGFREGCLSKSIT